MFIRRICNFIVFLKIIIMKIIINQSSNFAELQNQFRYSNCVYIIKVEQQTFGTADSPLVIPENSTLIFDGGKFTGGHVRLNNTIQNDVYYTVWENVEISGTLENLIWKIFRNDTLRPEWFGAIGNGTHDDTHALQQCIKLARANGAVVKLSPRRYIATDTIKIFSGTHIEGTLPGSKDYNIVAVHRGSSIEARFNSSKVLLDVNAANDDSGCYNFILKDFGLLKENDKQTVSAIRLYSEGFLCPRSGLIENLFISGFTIGLELRAFSYVKFSRLSINDCNMSIYINQKGEFVEFAWFYNVYSNTNVKDAIGIKIENGSNLHFIETDINGCKYGFWINALGAIFNTTISKMNFVGCMRSIWFHAAEQYITRVKVSEITIYGFEDYYDCDILFSASNPYCIDDCVFTDLFDSLQFPLGKEKDFIRIEDMSMWSCSFDRIRTYNKLSGLSHVKKAGVLVIPNQGEFLVDGSKVVNNSFTYRVSDSSPFDYNPTVLVMPQDNIKITSSTTNTQLGDLLINIYFPEGFDTAKNLLVRYFFPQF